MRDLESGTQLAGRYTLVRKLGAGGGAETWLANDRLTRATAALKIQTDDRLPADLLRREWQLCIRLMHAHIVRVFEYHDEPDSPFYSLQFIDGPDISVLAGAPLADVLPPIASLVDALRYAHGKDVVHRDIKAQNVLLDHNGAPYLIDFGVASSRGGDIGGGSPIAASPQSLDGQPASPADDIFALGGLVYELISGRSAYPPDALEDAIRTKVPEPLRAADGSDVDPAVASLVARMLDKDAARRPDAETVLSELADCGIRPGPAPERYVSSVRAARDEVIDTDAVVRPRTPAAEATSAEPVHIERAGGVSSRTVGIALAVLVLLLIGVVFLLPKTVDTERTEPVAETEATETEEPAEEATEPEPAEETAPERDERVVTRQEADRILGSLLAKSRTLEGRAVERWGGLAWKQGSDAYAAGDEAYLAKDYNLAQLKYQEAIDLIDPLLERVDQVFEQTLSDAASALENGDTADALRFYELAVAISPSHGPARAGLIRAQNLDTVISLTEQGFALERNLELVAALENFDRAIELDPEWQPAIIGRERVLATQNQLEFDARMTEGLTALAENDLLGARAAFRMAQELKPGSREPADGMLQVEQGLRLQNIVALEYEAQSYEQGESWTSAGDTYERLLELDADLAFAQDGLARSNRMAALHTQLETWIEDPDSLSSPRTMQQATNLVVEITRMPEIGPRLESQRDEVSRLLKRASTPLTVQLVSDNATDVSIYKVGKLGTFATTELNLRPGTYVAVGSRPGYRDVRLEFRVAPEIDMQPVVVRCEEQI